MVAWFSMFGFLEIVVLAMMFPGGLVTSLPPLPEDKALLSAAPEECLFYLSWYGMDTPRADSRNHTERLLAEPEVQQLAAGIWHAIQQALRAEGDPDSGLWADELLPLVKTVLTRPTAMYVSHMDFAEGNPNIDGALIVNLGREAPTVRETLLKLETVAGLNAQAVNVGGVAFRELQLPPGSPTVRWGLRGEHLIVAVGAETAAKVVQRMSAAAGAPAWLRAVHQRLPVERPAFVEYVNVQRILEYAAPFTAFVPELQRALDALGINDLQYVGIVAGLDAEGAVSHCAMATRGRPRGLLGMAGQEPLRREDLQRIPGDATWAVALRCDAARFYRDLLQMLANIDPAVAADFQQEVANAEQEWGFNILADLLEPLGDTWVLYNSPREGGLLFTGATLVVPLRDPQRARRTHDIVLRLLRQERGEAGVATSTFAGHTLHTLLFDEPVPLAPAWCLTDQELVVALYPQAVKSFLARSGGSTLAERAEVAGLLRPDASGRAPCCVCYENTPELFSLLYPVLQAAAPMLTGQLRREGFDLDPALLPRAGAILPHLRPGAMTVTTGDDGVYLTSRGTLAGLSGTTTLLLPMMWWLSVSGESVDAVPAAIPGEEVGRRAESANQLRQLVLAMHNYHDVHDRFPAPHSNDAQGKPLLSWRVHLLPYLGEDELYRQFKLDEPWDSDHNKKLIARMPKVFAVPRLELDEGHTCFQVPVGEKTIFPPAVGANPRGLSLASITDGTSNTILIVQTDPEHAVPWTAPADWKFDPETPKKGLFGRPGGRSSFAMADGSVRTFSADVDAGTLRALLTRNGGEVIDFDDPNVRPGPEPGPAFENPAPQKFDIPPGPR
jgi:hypothetical protein